MAYQNMKAEMKRYNITQSQVAELLGMSTNNVSLKINERIPMTVDEAKTIHQKLLPHAKLDYLLASDGDLPTEREREAASLDAVKDVLDEIGAAPEMYESLDRLRAKSGLTDGRTVR